MLSVANGEGQFYGVHCHYWVTRNCVGGDVDVGLQGVTAGTQSGSDRFVLRDTHLVAIQ
jgi:hypothetical protein